MSIETVNPFASRATAVLEADEVWYVEGGPVRLQTEEPESGADGVVLKDGQRAFKFANGESVTFWLATTVGATIVRMAVI